MRRKQKRIETRDAKRATIRADPIGEGLAKNNNRRNRFTPGEISFVKERCIGLTAKGLNDRQIQKEITYEKGHNAISILKIIKRLRKNKEIKKNPNNREIRKFSSEEIRLIKQKWIELSARGLNDTQIAKEIEEEKGWKVKSIIKAIYRVREKKEIEDNPNKRVKREFRCEEISLIKQKWIELSAIGKRDENIKEEIALKYGFNSGSVYAVIKRLRQNKEIGENLNKLKRFKTKEIGFIRQSWADLSEIVSSDRQIAKEIAKYKGWNPRSIMTVIYRLRKNKEIGVNKSRRVKREFIINRWNELSAQGMKDNKISKEIAQEKGWTAESIEKIIRRLHKNKEIAENPNKKRTHSEMSGSILFSGLAQAPEAMERFGEGKG